MTLFAMSVCLESIALYPIVICKKTKVVLRSITLVLSEATICGLQYCISDIISPSIIIDEPWAGASSDGPWHSEVISSAQPAWSSDKKK